MHAALVGTLMLGMMIASSTSDGDAENRRVNRDALKAAIDYATDCGCPVLACIGRMQTCLLSGICKYCSMAMPGKRQPIRGQLQFSKWKPIITNAVSVFKPSSAHLVEDDKDDDHPQKFEKRFWQVSFPKYRPKPESTKMGHGKLKEKIVDVLKNLKSSSDKTSNRTGEQRSFHVTNPFIGVHQRWLSALGGPFATGWFGRQLL